MDADNQKKTSRPAQLHAVTGPSAPSGPKGAPPENAGDDPLPNFAADDFFIKMNRDFRRPKPSEEAVAAALHAIQTLAGDAAERDVEAAAIESHATEDFAVEGSSERCPKCRAVNSGSNRFCGFCGTLLTLRDRSVPKADVPAIALVREKPIPAQPASEPQNREQHIHHHHHHYFPESVAKHSFGDAKSALTGEIAGAHPVAGAENAIQKLITDWTLCCNSKRLEDLLALYSPDAIVLRANVAPAHGRSAIRQLLQAALQGGLGDVELEVADAGVLGDIACLTGSSRMLVATVPGKRREETGKFLIVARRESGAWKILADSWCVDAAPPQSAGLTPIAPVVRAPRGK